MVKEPVLVIMAAGMGSRYGGLKQIDPLNSEGDLIIDFSVFDAIRAGFKKVIMIIKKENEKDFRERISNKIEPYIQVEYVHQSIDSLPAGYDVPLGRRKPWGTGHAILSCIDVINQPFAVINADDYYGSSSFVKIYDFLSGQTKEGCRHHAMIGYILENTLTDHGHVARGVCEIDENNMLTAINERVHIVKRNGHVDYSEDNGKSYITIPENSIVSLNIWGFDESILSDLKDGFVKFLDRELVSAPLQCEYYLPNVVGELLKEGKADVKVLRSEERWYGVTYKNDKALVSSAIEDMKRSGKYPRTLWDDLGAKACIGSRTAHTSVGGTRSYAKSL